MFARQPRHSLPEGRRVYAVGDVHGRLDLLHDLARQITADDAGRLPARTEIILLGDLVDRGPQSAEVVRFAMNAQPAFANLVTLKGNHESVMLQSLGGDLDMLARWLHVGGRETLESYGVSPALIEGDDMAALADAAGSAVPLIERAWLASLPLSLRIGDYLFVHAGVRPGVPLDEQDEEDLLWIRGEFLETRQDLGVTVVHGHTPAKRPEFRAHRIGIDTGAFASGRLTALGLQGRKRWLLST